MSTVIIWTSVSLKNCSGDQAVVSRSCKPESKSPADQ
eukprot:CAMPEP_0194766772 /NCGR_PEP_ID=MMETSP0323_2-20130528/33026_1 /TAXON_ID=2866 ORGANISM="Crypthecodinium cohnii, Strain Seligo" /NCGR_SAMPLE_ID=MMETSP0323_2 /ASSEMBLY_ACC=CAM_ASM_000346 /LENGTH=36 /DNA_ID= /DNA_START= /DNA_END= /DNA_ORIENTATION=